MILTLKARPVPRQLVIGDKDTDGWIYCGVSPHTGFDFHVSPQDSASQDWSQYAPNGRLPTLEELFRIYHFRKLVGMRPENYWAGAPHYLNSCWALNFETGKPRIATKQSIFLRRYVRGHDPFIQC